MLHEGVAVRRKLPSGAMPHMIALTPCFQHINTRVAEIVSCPRAYRW
jgi:hypothetical protein